MDVQDLSEGGFRIRTNELLRPGTEMLVELRFPNSAPVRSLASVAWTRQLNGECDFEIGGMFLEPDRDARMTITRHLEPLIGYTAVGNA